VQEIAFKASGKTHVLNTKPFALLTLRISLPRNHS
jgi:hypothetical protein